MKQLNIGVLQQHNTAQTDDNRRRLAQGIERQLLRRLHAHRVVRIDPGQLAGDHTDGHIDTTVRDAPGNTL